MSETQREYQPQVEAFLRGLQEGVEPAEAAYALALALTRAAALLQQLARTEAAARKDAPEWGRWAALQNAARAAVLQASTCRDLSAELAGRKR
jgi:phage portal protein BeeE